MKKPTKSPKRPIKSSTKTTRKSPNIPKTSPKKRPTKSPKRPAKTARKSPKKRPKTSPKNRETRPKNIDKTPNVKLEKGIRIGNKIINSISGPISFSFLRPKQKIYDSKEAPYFPLIVLFGDVHTGHEVSCTNCVCKRGSCCQTITDPSFLRLLDTLADDKHPVDFHVETTLSGRGEKGDDNAGYMIDIAAGDMRVCYQRMQRGTPVYKKYCPTERIRWHAVDIRNFSEYTENISKKYGVDFSVLKNPIPVEVIFSQIIMINQYLDGLGLDGLGALDHFLLTTSWKTVGVLGSFIDSNLFKNGDTKKFARALFSEFEKQGENSVIYKQVMKQTQPKFKKMSFWADIYASILDYNIEKKMIKQNDLVKLVDNIKGLETIKKIKKIDDSIAGSCVHLAAPLLDIYTLSRLLKQPDNGKRASLMFGFFGDAHVKNIIHILKTKMDYEEVHVNDSFIRVDDNFYKFNRCRVFDFSLDLTEEVKRHNMEIDKVSNFRHIDRRKSK